MGGRIFLRRAAAALASVLLACLPFFVGVFSDATGNTLLSDGPALTLLLLSFWLLLRALHKQTDLRFAGKRGCAFAFGPWRTSVVEGCLGLWNRIRGGFRSL